MLLLKFLSLTQQHFQRFSKSRKKPLCICWTTSRQRPMLQNCLPVKAIWDLNLIPFFSHSLGGASCHTDRRALNCNEHEEECSWGWKLFSLSHARSWWFPKPWPRPWIYVLPCRTAITFVKGRAASPSWSPCRQERGQIWFLVSSHPNMKSRSMQMLLFYLSLYLKNQITWQLIMFLFSATQIQFQKWSFSSSCSFFNLFFFYFFGWKQQMDKCVDKQ